MTDNKLKYSKNIIDIADILFANPGKEVSGIVSGIAVKCQKSERTVWRWVEKAQKYNSQRIKKQEIARDKVLRDEAKKTAKEAILTRNKALYTLTKIAMGKTRKVSGEIIVPTDGDRIRAIQQISKIEGWDSADRVDLTTGGEKINQSTEIIFRDYGGTDKDG